MKINVTTSLPDEIKKASLALGFSFSECLEFGIRFKAAELNDINYPSNLLSNKIESLSEKLGEAYKRISELEGENKIGGENGN